MEKQVQLEHIVIICTANICRSPMAEGILRYYAELSGQKKLVISSMGTHGERGFPATDLAIKVCKENGIDITGHKSRPLIEEDLMKAKFILCMEPIQKKHVTTFFPAYNQKNSSTWNSVCQ